MKNKILIFVVCALALLALPIFAGQFGQGWVRIMALSLLYVLLALGLNIVVGYAGLLDLGFVAFYAVGAYMYALLASPHLIENFPWIAEMFPNGMHTPYGRWCRWRPGWQPLRGSCWAHPCSSCAVTTWPS
jgi:branched-chain amino acid transport system permease protein